MPIIKDFTDVLIVNTQAMTSWINESSQFANIKTGVATVIGAIKSLITSYREFMASHKGLSVFLGVFKTMSQGILGFVKIINKGFFSLIKNWDLVVGTFQETTAKIRYFFALTGSKIKEAMVIGINAVKIVFISLAQIIAEKVLGGLRDFLEVAAKLPFVGDKFQEAADKINEFSTNLQTSADEARKASADAIAAAKEEQDAVESLLLTETAEAIAAANARKNLNDENEASVEIGIAALEATTETVAVVAELTEHQKTLIELQNEYSAAIALSTQQAADGFITQEEAQSQAISAAEKYADALYSIGVSAATAAEDGGEALRAMLQIISDSRSKIEANDAGEDAATAIIDGLETGLEEKTNDVQNTISSIMKGIGGTVQKAWSFISKAVKWASVFDPDALLESLKGIKDGIENFFYSDLQNLGGTFAAGADIIKQLVSGIKTNLSSIITTINNVLQQISSYVVANGPGIFSQAVDILIGIFTGIANNIGILLDAGLAIITGIVKGITDNAESLFGGIITAIVQVVGWISENVGAIVSLALNLALAISNALLNNIDVLILGIIAALPVALMGVIEALPSIAQAFTMLTTSILLFMATQFLLSPLILANAITRLLGDVANSLRTGDWSAFSEIGENVIWGLWVGVRDAFTGFWNLFSGLFTGIIDNIKSIFGIASPSKVFESIGKNIIQGLINGISSMIDGLKGIMGSVIDAVSGGLSTAGGFVADVAGTAWDGITGAVTATGDAIAGAAQATGNFISDTASAAGAAVTDFFDWGWFANGTKNAPGGLSVIGENGPELVNLPKGSQVTPAMETSRLLAGAAAAAAPMSIGTNAGRIIKISEVLEVDGRILGSVAFEYLDREAGIA